MNLLHPYQLCFSEHKKLNLVVKHNGITIPQFRTSFEIIALEALAPYQHRGNHIIIPYSWPFEQQKPGGSIRRK